MPSPEFDALLAAKRANPYREDQTVAELRAESAAAEKGADFELFEAGRKTIESRRIKVERARGNRSAARSRFRFGCGHGL